MAHSVLDPRLGLSKAGTPSNFMRLLIFTCLLMLVTSCSTSNPSAKIAADSKTSSEEEPIWFWSTGKDDPEMSLEVRLDQKIIYQTTIHIGHEKRSIAETRAQDKMLSYSFAAPRAIVWQGYKDNDETTPANQKILGDIWSSSGESDCVILGVSFRGRHSVYMHEYHFVHPYQRNESTMATGLTIVTAPVQEKKTNASNKPASGNPE
jgi:hypothetical protein